MISEFFNIKKAAGHRNVNGMRSIGGSQLEQSYSARAPRRLEGPDHRKAKHQGFVAKLFLNGLASNALLIVLPLSAVSGARRART